MSDEPDNPEHVYVNIRQILGSLIGTVLVDITQHDQAEFEADRKTYVQLHFDNGEYLKVYVGDDGFDHNCEEKSDG